MKIMVGFDGSKVSEAAVELAAERAQAFGAKIFLVHSMVGGPDVSKRDFENNERELEYHKNEFKKKDIVCESLLSVSGLEPGEDLTRLAEEHRVEVAEKGCRAGFGIDQTEPGRGHRCGDHRVRWFRWLIRLGQV